MITTKKLGEAGEAEVARVLRSRGYTVREIGGNYPVIDLEVDASRDFRISVKTSASKRHVRLGSTASISQLRDSDFVFAIMPQVGGEALSPELKDYDLWIIPGGVARADALWVHETYLALPSRTGAERSGSAGVLVKSYSSRPSQREVWERWARYAGAWSVLPPPR